MRLCETCAKQNTCNNYEQIARQQKLNLIDCDDYSLIREDEDAIQGLQEVQD